MRSYPPDFNDNENSPCLLVVVPSVVFWQNTEAAASGSRLAESYTTPVTVNCPKTEKLKARRMARKPKRSFFIEDRLELKIRFTTRWLHGWQC